MRCRLVPIGCAVLLGLSGCGGAHLKPQATGTSMVRGAAAKPTGSGSALDQSYRRRCAASLSHPAPQHASGKGSVREIRLRSPDSSRTPRSIFVYRPGGVSESAQLPVVYVLHGLPGDPAELWTKLGGARLLDAEFAHGAAPYEVVSLDGRGTRHGDTEWADSADGADRVESFLLDVAIPAVEGANRRDACHRAITGFSMGGYGAMNLAQRHPDVFGQVASISGYFHLDDPDEVFGNDPALQRANTPDQQVARFRGLRVMLLEAGQENTPLVKGEAGRFAKLLIDQRIPVVLDYSPGSHNSEYAVAQQPEVSAFFQAGWRPQG
jgi:S-formylglutathione hydrolase FrmB